MRTFVSALVPLLFFCFFSLQSFAQEKKKILLKSADFLEYNRPVNPDVQFLKGNVVFQHENSLLYCDSALLYITKNAMDAYGNVHIRVSDATQIYGEKLHYDGNEKKAIMEQDVELIDNNIVLHTQKLYYDLENGIGYYLDSAEIQDPHNTLVSKHGYYYSGKKEFFFRHGVVVTGNNFKMISDSLMYNTITEQIDFYGNTHIQSDSTDIYCEYGWYNTLTDQTKLFNRAKLINGSSVLEGDTLYYDKKLGLGKARRNMVFRDTLENVMLLAHSGDFSEKDSSVLATDSAVFITWEGTDSLYLHGDTLFTTKDSLLGREIQAYYGVRFYRFDMQGVCDSLYYCEKDSLMRMFENPCLWSDSTQMTAEYIQFTIDRNEIRELYMKDNAFIVSMYEELDFQQVKGVQMNGYFENNNIDHMLVTGNAEAIYFIEDENGAKTGINKSSSASMDLFFENSEVVAINMIGSPQGTIYPNKDLGSDQRKLAGFEWRAGLRPLNKNDIFRKAAPVNTGGVVRGNANP
ncbi:MAG TPA: OstA-like protein [Bacteroidales bacterium]|nr:OstA-like protein [Bacteroidales bacterium]